MSGPSDGTNEMTGAALEDEFRVGLPGSSGWPGTFRRPQHQGLVRDPRPSRLDVGNGTAEIGAPR